MTPLLTQIVAPYEGLIILGKLNVDTEAALVEAMQLPVQSIPAVFILSQGQFVSHFTGLKPEAELKQLIQQVLTTHQQRTSSATSASSPASASSSDVTVEHEEIAVDDATRVTQLYRGANDALTAGDIERASALYTSIIEDASKKPLYNTHKARATAGLIKCLLQQYQQALRAQQDASAASVSTATASASSADTGSTQKGEPVDYTYTMDTAIESAQHLLHTIQSQSTQQPDLAAEMKDYVVVTEAIKQLQMTADAHRLFTATSSASPEASASASASAAEALKASSMKAFLTQQYAEALEEGLQLLRVDRASGKALLLNYLEQLGPQHPLTAATRKRMAQFLFN